VALRTTPALVASIIEVDPGDDVTPYIEIANLLVTDVCVDPILPYSDERLEQIERYLAAHFYDLDKPRTASESIKGGTSEKYEQISTDLGLSVTKWGQTAKVLDYKGNLALIDNRNKERGKGGTAGYKLRVQVTHLGVNPRTYIPTPE